MQINDKTLHDPYPKFWDESNKSNYVMIRQCRATAYKSLMTNQLGLMDSSRNFQVHSCNYIYK
jgi:hypothetical protein